MLYPPESAGEQREIWKVKKCYENEKVKLGNDFTSALLTKLN